MAHEQTPLDARLLRDDTVSYGTLRAEAQPAPQTRSLRPWITVWRIAILAIVLLLVYGIYQVLLALYLLNIWDPFHDSNPPSADFSKETFAVGFDLTAGYGTAAVSFWNGTYVEIGKVQGDQEYNRVLARLSLATSRHPTPPYYNRGQHEDIPRQIKRSLRKSLGLPASKEVGALVSVLSPLLDQTNDFLVSRYPGHGKVRYAMITVPHTPAIYMEDLVDTCAFLGILAIRPPFTSGDTASWPPTEVNSVLAGMGLGLCEDWRPDVPCKGKVPEAKPPRQNVNVLNVLFTQQALASYITPSASAEYESYCNGMTNFTLGLRAEDEFGQELYWSKVRETVATVLDSGIYPARDLDAVVIHGEHAHHERLQSVIADEVARREATPQWFVKHPVYAGARGAAELAKRCMRRPWPQRSCIPDLRAKQMGW